MVPQLGLFLLKNGKLSLPLVQRAVIAAPGEQAVRPGDRMTGERTFCSCSSGEMSVEVSGLAPDGQSWVACRPGFFLSVRVLSRLFRRRFLEELQQLHRALYVRK